MNELAVIEAREINRDLTQPMVVRPPDNVGMIFNQVNELVLRSQQVRIQDEDDLLYADEFLKTLKAQQKMCEDRFEEPVAVARKFYELLRGWRDRGLNALDAATRNVKRLREEYTTERDRKAAEEHAKLVAAEQARQQEQVLAQAVALEQEGRAAEAEAILQAPPPVLAPPPPPKRKSEGISESIHWKAEVDDLFALIKHIAGNPKYINLVRAEMAALNALARSLRENFDLPGCRAVPEKRTNVRA